ncbi:MAG: helix-hairpin-helix domain-containing protein [Thermovirgaceae bacterium]|nr:helix-hairpin-helix domain-containing protein [Thermovirgaceae bacterium]
MDWIKSKRGLLFLAAGLVCLIAAGSIVAAFSGRWEKRSSGAVAGPAPSSAVQSDQSPGADLPVQEGELLNGEKQWVIYITGAVLRPGVYRLPQGTRVYQAVEQAGGLSSEADPEAFNMALPLDDGVHIHVPRRGEGSAPESFSPGNAQNAGARLIDINRADSSALDSLPGIGPKTAQEIIRFREERGKFSSVEDLLSVKGIGPAKLSAIRDLVTVSR